MLLTDSYLFLRPADNMSYAISIVYLLCTGSVFESSQWSDSTIVALMNIGERLYFRSNLVYQTCRDVIRPVFSSYFSIWKDLDLILWNIILLDSHVYYSGMCLVNYLDVQSSFWCIQSVGRFRRMVCRICGGRLIMSPIVRMACRYCYSRTLYIIVLWIAWLVVLMFFLVDYHCCGGHGKMILSDIVLDLEPSAIGQIMDEYGSMMRITYCLSARTDGICSWQPDVWYCRDVSG